MKRFILFSILILFINHSIFSQENEVDELKFTLQEVIELAQKQSPDIMNARHAFRSKYWSYISYKANYLPSLNFSSNPDFNHSINPITLSDGTKKYISQNLLETNATLSINQNIALTGGTLSLYAESKANIYAWKQSLELQLFNLILKFFSLITVDIRVDLVRAFFQAG